MGGEVAGRERVNNLHICREEAVERVAKATREWQERTETYQRQLEEDLSHSQTTSMEPRPEPAAEPLQLEGVMDLVVYMGECECQYPPTHPHTHTQL